MLEVVFNRCDENGEFVILWIWFVLNCCESGFIFGLVVVLYDVIE